MITGLIGNGAAIVLAGAAFLLAKFRYGIPRFVLGKWTDEAALTAAIIGSYFSGELLRSGGIGAWVVGAIRWAANLLGGSVGMAVLALAALALTLIVGIAVFRSGASEKAMIPAMAAPFVFAIFSFGIFHTIDTFTQPYAVQAATTISSWMGVS